MIPFFQALDFQTRKFEDFKLWCCFAAVKLHKLGYYCILEGRKLLVLISSPSPACASATVRVGQG